MNPSVNISTRIPNVSLPLIDVLRGFAAFWVVLFHVRVDLWVGLQEIAAHPENYTATEHLLAWLSLPTFFGGSGVMLFFLLSGFCVHMPFAAKRTFEWKPYAVRRFFRIAPPYLGAIALTVACEWLVHMAVPTAATSPSSLIVRSSLMIQNYGSGAGQLFGNPSLWSLPVEMELYLAYPVFLYLLRRFGAFWALATSVLISGIATIFYLRGAAWPQGNFAHFWLIWCSGALLAELWKTQQLPPLHKRHWFLMVAAFALAAFARLKDANLALQNYLWAIAYGLLMWAAVWHSTFAQRIHGGTLRALVWLGTISYSLYLVHFPLFYLWGKLWVVACGSKPASFLVPVAGAVLVIPFAWCFYRLIESPSHRLARSVASRPAIAVAK